VTFDGPAAASAPALDTKAPAAAPAALDAFAEGGSFKTQRLAWTIWGGVRRKLSQCASTDAALNAAQLHCGCFGQPPDKV